MTAGRRRHGTQQAALFNPLTGLLASTSTGRPWHKIPLTTIDKIVAELKLPRVDYIKRDIEGAERQALKGGTATIRAFRPRLAIAAEHLPDDPVVIPAVVRQLWNGYSMECGPCYRMTYYDGIAPDVLYFKP